MAKAPTALKVQLFGVLQCDFQNLFPKALFKRERKSMQVLTFCLLPFRLVANYHRLPATYINLIKLIQVANPYQSRTSKKRENLRGLALSFEQGFTQNVKMLLCLGSW